MAVNPVAPLIVDNLAPVMIGVMMSVIYAVLIFGMFEPAWGLGRRPVHLNANDSQPGERLPE